MSRSERGSASILFAVVVLPMLFILAMIGVELSQFFSMREEVQRIVDGEAKESLGRPYASDYVARRISSRLGALKPYVEVAVVKATTSGKRGEVVVQGTFNGVMAQFVGFLLQKGMDGIPFAISSAVRRTSTSALILLDRTVDAKSPKCGDQNLILRASVVANLARDLQAAGASTVQIGVIPGVQQEIDLLSVNDRVPRCGGGASESLFQVASVEGVQGIKSIDSVEVAYAATQLLLLKKDAGAGTQAAIEQRALIMVAPPFEARSEAITTTFSLLEHEIARQEARISAVGVVVGGPSGGIFFDVKSGSESGRAKYLHVSEDEAKGGDLRVALLNHIQGQTFVAR